MSCKREKVDRLSSMPDEVLSQILSLMPTKYAIRTGILSRRWRNLWMSVTSLDFDYIQPNLRVGCVTECVDRVLKLCTTPQVKLFRLPFSKFWLPKSSIYRWISEAVRLNVRELDIQVRRVPDVQVRPVEMPMSLFTCKTLTTLRLRSVIHDRDVWNLSSPVNLPCLKTLEIDLFEEHCFILFKLIHGCPVLESLALEIAWHDEDDEDYYSREYNFNIPTLKRFELTIPKCKSIFTVVLNVPNLQYLFFGGEGGLFPDFVFQDVSSLDKATIDFVVLDKYEPVELLRGISAAESISWVWCQVPIKSSEFPVFPNLKRLELKNDEIDWKSLCQFLENAPVLEYLSFDACTGLLSFLEDYCCCWTDPPSVPTCMVTNLRTLHVKLGDQQGHLHLQFLKYMLGNAKVLKTLTLKQLNLSLEEEVYFCELLWKLPKASMDCEVHFVGNYFSIICP